MDEQEIFEQRYRFFSDRGATLAFEQDKTLVTLFTGIVAGLVALLVSKDVAFWSGLFFLLAALSAIVGLGVCLFHMAFSAKVMLALAAMFGGENNVPNLVMREEPTDHALKKNRLWAQMCYVSQLTCLFWAVFFAALGVLSLVWHVVGWTGLILGILFIVGLIVSVFRPLLVVYRLSQHALEMQKQVQNTPIQ
ncbi:MAG: hypothetical protein GX594_08895 [Pirellulaceae bacterium]|nr:hypothetical protein [Pirellulaceae bacterium]